MTITYGQMVGYQNALIFVVQLIMWGVSAFFKTEKLFDLTGSLTYIAAIAFSLIIKGHLQGNNSFDIGGNWRVMFITISVLQWAVRLGLFLFFRALKFGDQRFDTVKRKPARFLVYWIVQYIWIMITILPALTIIYKTETDEILVYDYFGMVLYVVGFLLEVVADTQKCNFKSNPMNKGKFIQTGVWRYMRYPNYYGEFMVWWGIFILGSNVYQENLYFLFLALSPVYLMVQIIFVSGIRIQEEQAKQRWGSDPEYLQYRERTSCCGLCK